MRLRQIVFVAPAVARVAEEAGFLARHGLQVDTAFTRSSTEQLEGLRDGTWDLGYTAIDNVVAWNTAGRADLAMLLQAERTTALWLFARPERRSVGELRDTELGVDAVDTGFALVLRRMLRENGVPDEAQRLVSIGGTHLRLEALLRGEISATLLNPPFDERARAAGMRELARSTDILPDYPGVVAVATRGWIERNADAVRRYTRALLETAAWVRAGHEDEARRIVEGTGLSPVAARDAVDSITPDLEVSVRGVETVIDLRRQLGLLRAPRPSATDHIDRRHRPSAGGVSRSG